MKIKNKPQKKYHLKAFLNSSKVQSLTTKKKKRITSRIQAVKKLGITKLFLRVTYTTITDNFNKVISPTNEGEYFSIIEFWQAWRAFNEI